MKQTLSRLLMAGALAVGLLSSQGVANAGQSVDADPGVMSPEDASWVAVVPEGGNYAPETEGNFTPQAYWAPCGVLDSNTKIVRTFTRAATAGVTPYLGSGQSSLACGSGSTWGYRHIVNEHLAQWQARAAQASENWRDTADYGIEWALKDPDRVTYRSGNDTYCFSREILLINNNNGQVVDSYFPNVVVARVSKNIITAFPSSRQC